jgi:hypothetical protein
VPTGSRTRWADLKLGHYTSGRKGPPRKVDPTYVRDRRADT